MGFFAIGITVSTTGEPLPTKTHLHKLASELLNQKAIIKSSYHYELFIQLHIQRTLLSAANTVGLAHHKNRAPSATHG